ncbi:hypothetical protein [Longimicrobium sp.]|uniref:hypothetical protein n=1 Tax=Longimicrobium sp. TaxID=2029185 RepID=UPI002B56E312|nr:hypothetical protein [Longimicrobium sp.]HSU14754.1 hypothetical protein [Longimicrobium sp.]
MRSILRVFLFITAAATLPRTVHAQRVEMPEGGPVRVTAAGWHPGRVAGTLVQATADSVMIRTGDSLVAIPRGRVTRVEVPDGRRRYATRGMLIGIGVGAVIGAIGGITCHDDCPDGTTALTTFIGAGGGMLLGGAAGALVTGPRWRDASPPTTAIRITPAPGGRGIALTLRRSTR